MPVELPKELAAVFQAFAAEMHTGSLSSLLPRLLTMSKALGNTEMQHWVSLELHGYYELMQPNDEVPTYRTVSGLHYDLHGRPLVLRDPKLSFVNEYRLRNSVAELERWSRGNPTLRIQDPDTNAIIKEHLHLDVINFAFATSQVDGILMSIRAKAIDWWESTKGQIAIDSVASVTTSSDSTPKSDDGKDKSSGTYYEKIEKKWKNNPVLTWLVISCGVFAAIAGIIGKVEPILMHQNPQPVVHIWARVYEPRSIVNPKSLVIPDWFGYSCAAFVAEKVNGHQPGRNDAFWDTSGGREQVVLLTLSYDVSPDGAPCVIEEIGCEVESTKVIQGRLLYFIPSTGADGSYEDAACEIRSQPAVYPAALFTVSEEEGATSAAFPPKFRYLAAKEPMRIRLRVYAEPQNCGQLPGRQTITTTGLLVRPYAKIVISGISKIVHGEPFRWAIPPTSLDKIPKAGDEDFELLKSAKERAYQP